MKKVGLNCKDMSKNYKFIDRAKGCIYGALFGDAWGATLEFRTPMTITQDLVSESRLLPGGGPIHVGPGQITDDGELSICIFEGLLQGMPNGSIHSEGESKNDRNVVFLPDNIARMYGKWMRSPPFDIGITTTNAFEAIKSKNVSNPSQVATETALSKNMWSESNGAAMRLAPLAVYTSQLEDFQDIYRAVKIDTNMSHPNEIVVQCNYALTLCVRSLLNGESSEVAYSKIKEYT